MNCDRGMWRCPVCNSTAQLEGLEVDHYIWGILSQLERYGIFTQSFYWCYLAFILYCSSLDVEDITIDPSANWKAIEKPKDSADDEGTFIRRILQIWSH